jgi:hypothetical protein
MNIVQGVLNQHNLLRSYKFASEQVTSNEYKVVISADKVPRGQHAGRFNAPSCAEVAVLLVGQENGSRDIVLEYQDKTVKRNC